MTDLRSDLLYDIGVWRDNDKEFLLTYEKKDKTIRTIHCSPSWNFIRQDKSMISVYDEENEGNRSLYVDKILNWAKCKTPEEELNHKYQDSKTIYNNMMNLFKHQTNFLLWYQPKPISEGWEYGDLVRFIECEWNWTSGDIVNGLPESVIVFDVRQNSFEELCFEDIKRCEMCDKKNVSEFTNDEFSVIMDSVYDSIRKFWNSCDYQKSILMIKYLNNIMKHRINM